MLIPVFFQACSSGNVTVVRDGLCAGLDPNARYKSQTPLMYACENGRPEVVQLLLDNGARVDEVDSYNRTALHHAAKNVRVSCAEVLMAGGARTDIESTLGGETAADIVHVRGNIELTRTVLYYHTSKSGRALTRGSPKRVKKESPVRRYDSPTRKSTRKSPKRRGLTKDIPDSDDEEESVKEGSAVQFIVGSDAVKTGDDTNEEGPATVPQAISLARRAPPAVIDEDLRHHTPPRRPATLME